MKVLVDVNVLLDVLLNRKPWSVAASIWLMRPERVYGPWLAGSQ
jgi:hypothetical protein